MVGLFASYRGRLQDSHGELLEEIREELLKSEHERYVALANHVHDIGDESVADLLSDIDLAVIDRDVREVQDVEAALRCINTGQFAVCTNCGAKIDHEHLGAYPTTKRGYTCQRRSEQPQAKPRHASL
jgi:DnaK suppressor protein